LDGGDCADGGEFAHGLVLFSGRVSRV
jgi:hypothetical protein